MKHLIIIIAMASGLAHGQPVVMNTNIVDSGSIRIVEDYPRGTYGVGGSHYPITNTEIVCVLDDKAIKRAIENGDVCRVRGEHEWRYQAFNGAYVFKTESDAKSRKCDLCGRKETKQEEWKEGEIL